MLPLRFQNVTNSPFLKIAIALFAQNWILQTFARFLYENQARFGTHIYKEGYGIAIFYITCLDCHIDFYYTTVKAI